MAIKSYTEQLEEVQAKISQILSEDGSQEWSQGNRRNVDADLATLQRREEYLRPFAARESRGGLRMRQGVPRNG